MGHFLKICMGKYQKIIICLSLGHKILCRIKITIIVIIITHFYCN
jgi:hypothetical protein